MSELDIPIVAFPPFKLRSSMIDKDPLIWQHMLEVYIDLFEKLIAVAGSDVKLNARSKQQLTAFLRGYLYETSEESSKIFSLGAINPDIVENQKKLKEIVFGFFKTYNLVNAGMTGQDAWNFAKVYVKLAVENSATNQSLIHLNTVRQLLLGTLKSKLNNKSNDVSLVKSLQDKLILMISDKKFSPYDLETLYVLLGQKTLAKGAKRSGKSDRKVNTRRGGNYSSSSSSSSSIGGSNGLEFAEKFVNKQWIESLESLYNNGESIHSKQLFQVMLVSLISLSPIQIANLIQKSLRIHQRSQLVKSYPLVTKVVLSKRFGDLYPDLHDKLSFLTKKSVPKAQKFDEKKLHEITDLFPQLNDLQAKTLLNESNGDVSAAVNRLLEHPEELGSVKEYKEKLPKTKGEKTKKKQTRERSVTPRQKPKSGTFDYKMGDKIVQVQLGKKEHTLGGMSKEETEELKKKSLSQALRMIYESDEDEPDDTYAEQELTSGPAMQRSKPKKSVDRLDTADDTEFDDAAQDTRAQNETDVKLFLIYKTNPELLATSARHSNYRSQLKAELHWTDEQIEGWAKMLGRNPRKFRMLEQEQIEGALNEGGKRRTKWQQGDEEQTRPRRGRPQAQSQAQSHSQPHGPADTRKKQRDKSKNKAKRANHNRKAAHDKKAV